MKCKHHGPAAQGVWACPTCLVELRDELRQTEIARSTYFAERNSARDAWLARVEQCDRLLYAINEAKKVCNRFIEQGDAYTGGVDFHSLLRCLDNAT